MNTQFDFSPSDLVAVTGDRLVTTSLKVAEVFGKNHRDVLRKLDSLGCSSGFTERNFALSEYKDSTGRNLAMWEMTKNGFVILVMGFTGKKAMQFKEAYIEAFDWMAEQLSGQKSAAADTCISDAQAYHLRMLVSNIAMKAPEDDRPSRFSMIYGQLKKAFGVKRYREIPASQFPAAVALLNDLSGDFAALPSPVEPAEKLAGIQTITLPAPRPAPVEVSADYLLNPDGSAVGRLLSDIAAAADSGRPVLVNNADLPRQEWIALLALLRQQDQKLSMLKSLVSTKPTVIVGSLTH